MVKPFLSVVVPVYNVEKYLRQCVDSIIKKSTGKLEIVLVDDGATDNSGVICDEYAKNYDFVKVVHKPNGGLSSARNAGIDVALGEYITFADSDDWWNPDVDLQKMLDSVRVNPQTEMFLFTSLDYREGQGYFKRAEHQNFEKFDCSSKTAYYKSLIQNGNMEVSACTKILSLPFVRANLLYFKEGIKGEDNEWTIRLLRAVNTVQIIDEPLYMCRGGRVGSISNTIKIGNVIDLLHIVKDSIDYYQDKPQDPLKEYEFCFCAYLWFCALGLTDSLTKEEKKSLKSLFDKTKSVCAYSNSKKTKLSYAVYRVFGYSITCWVLGLYIKLRAKKSIGREKINGDE